MKGVTLPPLDWITPLRPRLDDALYCHGVPTPALNNLDHKLLGGLARKGFRLNFGDDGTGWQFKYMTRGGGYYFKVGCSELIVAGEVGLIQLTDLVEFVADGAQFQSGKTLEADLIVLATGYQGQEALVSKLFGEAVASRIGQIWVFGEGQELRNMFACTCQPELWFIAGSFAQCRIYSKYLALQIKALEAGLIEDRSWSQFGSEPGV